MNASDGPTTPALRSWPRDLPASAEAIEISCIDCRTPYRADPSIAGFRMRCPCGSWIDFPAGAALTIEAAGQPPHSKPPRLPTAAGARTVEEWNDPDGDDGEIIFAPIPVNANVGPGVLRRASSANQTRWTNQTVLEFALLIAALLGPQMAAHWWASGREHTLLLPLCSLASLAAVSLVAAWVGTYGRFGIRGARPRYFAEAAFAAGVGVAAASLYVEWLREMLPIGESDGLEILTSELGVPLTLFVIALTPAVLEEIIFRGALQRRLMALLGHGLGLGVTAVAFALCHMAPSVLLVHLGLGLYLGWLRERSGSLLPCMLTHFVYNGSLVLLAA